MKPEMKRMLDKMKASLGEGPIFESPEDILKLRDVGPSPFFTYINRSPVALPLVRDIVWAGPFGDTRARVYRPDASSQPLPALVFFHGGGWVAGSLDMEDSSLRLLARESGCCVVSVDYVLAPEHRFPEPIVDCVAAVRAVRERAPELGIDPGRIAIGGSSAGANLALAAANAIRAEDANPAWLRFILLNYGVFTPENDSASSHAYGDGRYGLTSAAMDLFALAYLGPEGDRADSRVNLLRADYQGCPPVFLSVAELDLLCDDSVDLARVLADAGIPVSLEMYKGVIHGFSLMVSDVPEARQAIVDAANALRKGLHPDATAQ